MHEVPVWTFFYGSYMNLDVLREVEIVPRSWEKAKLGGFGLRICPRANLVPARDEHVYGIVANTTHEELERLYAHARDVLGERYYPHAVLVQTFSGVRRPALCYIAHNMVPRIAENAYVERISRPAREYDFPGWYVEQIESYRPLKLQA